MSAVGDIEAAREHGVPFHYTLKPAYHHRARRGDRRSQHVRPAGREKPPYRARAAAAARPIHPATTLPAPEVDVELLVALVLAAVPVELAVESEEEVPVAEAEEDLPVSLLVEEAVGELLVLGTLEAVFGEAASR